MLAGSALAQAPVTVVEYYNKTIASYFLTGRAAEQATLDGVSDFQRTGMSFVATAAAGASAPLDAVCRYRINVTGSSFSSHFYGLTADCATIAALNLPNFTNEGFDFAVEKPTAGVCPAGSPIPIYRSLRSLTPVDVPNHRYSVSLAAYQEMITRGWSGEGAVFCARSVTPETARATFSASTSYESSCAMPRVGSSPHTGRAYADRQGTLADEKNWLRSWSDETYLWYREIPNLNAASYATLESWYGVLKTPALALSGAAKDRFHYIESTDEFEAGSAGVSYGYGITWSAVASIPPRRWLAAVVTAGSPAAIAGIKRGDSIISIDGVDFRNGPDVNTLSRGLFPPTIGENHSFVLAPIDGSAQKTVALTSASVTIVPVPVSGIVNTPTGRVGYIAFTTFNTFSSEKAIADAVAGLVAAGGVTDLVLDLRYNGGGYVFISAETAFMIAGLARTNNKVYARDKTNDKRPFGPDTVYPFYNGGSGLTGGVAQGQALPSVNLARVFVLTQSGTASASEAVINGLRGIDVEVVLIGAQTVGKPHGFRSEDNCGTTYSTIQFSLTNQKGEGDYVDGFAPTCRANDDLTRALGDPAEGQLAAALSYRATRVCPALVSAITQDSAPKRTTGGKETANLLAIQESPRASGNENMMTPRGLSRNGGLPVVPTTPADLGSVNAVGRANPSDR